MNSSLPSSAVLTMYEPYADAAAALAAAQRYRNQFAAAGDQTNAAAMTALVLKAEADLRRLAPDAEAAAMRLVGWQYVGLRRQLRAAGAELARAQSAHQEFTAQLAERLTTPYTPAGLDARMDAVLGTIAREEGVR